MVSKSLRDTAYYKKKALVRKIVDGFIGEVEMLDSGDVLRIDQRELETVLPDIGKPVLVVSGVGSILVTFGKPQAGDLAARHWEAPALDGAQPPLLSPQGGALQEGSPSAAASQYCSSLSIMSLL